MNVIGYIFIMFVIGGVPLSFGHPDTMGAKIETHEEIPPVYEIIGIKKMDNGESLELFSSEWFWKNFILILIGLIVVIVTPVLVISLKEEKERHIIH